MAGRLGQQIRRPITVTEESARSFGPSPFNSKGSAGVFANGREGSIVAGRISITAKVSVEYELID